MTKLFFKINTLFLILFANTIFADSITVKIPNKITDTLNNIQNIPKIQMADVLYENGKIYTVVLVLITIFASIIFYLIKLDKKITKLENPNK